MAKHRHNHIVTRSQLELFAADGQIQCHFLHDGSAKPIGTRDAAARKNFYVVRDKDRAVSTAFEQGMSPLEGRAVEIMRKLEALWPLPHAQRAVMTEFVALQAVRSPAWRRFFDEYRVADLPRRTADLSTDTKRAQFTELSASDQFRLELMLDMKTKLSTLFGSMYWSLLYTRSGKVAISDHPLVPVPLTESGVAPAAPIPAGGLVNTIEYRLPISPELFLVMCWRDAPGDDPVPRRARPHQLKGMNSSVIAQAERQWFHRPDVSVPHMIAGWLPISFELFPDYNAMAASESIRRREAHRLFEQMLESDEPLIEVPVVTWEERGAA